MEPEDGTQDQGSLYVFEGMDGVGKSTVAEEFSEAVDALFLQSPGPGVDDIRGYVDSDIHSKQTKFLMYMASNSAVSDRIDPHLEAGNDVVLDRYFPTTVVYNEATEEQEPGKWTRQAHEYDLIQPNRIFYLHTDEETRKERMNGREEVGARGETDDQFMAQVRDAYEEAIGEFDMTPVEAIDGVDNVVDKLLTEVNQHNG